MSNPNQATHDKLQAFFNAEYIEIIDNSAKHAGHAAMKGITAHTSTHLAIVLVSTAFEGKPVIQRHRLVQKALADEFAGSLHALELKAFTPAEWQQRKMA